MLKLAIAMAFGIIGGRIARRCNLPDVTGYLILGLFLGPSFLQVITESEQGAIQFVNEFALACIAFAIGGEFLLASIKNLGKKVLIITIGEVLGAITIVFVIMYFILGKSFAFSIVIAAMSASTAPAGTIMVMRQYRAYGPLSNTILPVAALDDAFGIMSFGIAMSLAKMSMGQGSLNLFKIVSTPLFEILGALVLGLVLGLILSYLLNKVKGKEELLFVTLCFIVGAIGLANYVNLSPLLTNMMVGAVVVNRTLKARKVFMTINEFTPPFNLLFFTFAGASLDLSVLTSIGLMGIVYVLARAGGKILGAGLASSIMNASETVRKYLGIALLPQGGVVIGLSMIVSREFPEFSLELTTLILFSVFVFMISGPVLAKFAITKAGEINGLDKKVG